MKTKIVLFRKLNIFRSILNVLKRKFEMAKREKVEAKLKKSIYSDLLSGKKSLKEIKDLLLKLEGEGEYELCIVIREAIEEVKKEITNLKTI